MSGPQLEEMSQLSWNHDQGPMTDAYEYLLLPISEHMYQSKLEYKKCNVSLHTTKVKYLNLAYGYSIS